ncbi:MAG: hypothetical protein M3Y56_11595 [Armatimonadota bacterium]|nr:hypothetical protein [Armatimonadota bacterium]
MIKVQRASLDEDHQTEIDLQQLALDGDNPSPTAWEDFRNSPLYPGLKTALNNVFHDKCGYCEAPRATLVDHYWPRAPHPQNQNRGGPAKMFVWDNLVLACPDCNGFECKAARMEWDNAGNPLLLNPCLDEPICYLTFTWKEGPKFTVGWMEPRQDITSNSHTRAEYTIRRLKLNTRENLPRGRARALLDFLAWTEFLIVLGPDREAPSGYTVRQRLTDLLSAKEPYLSGIRQILYQEPEYVGLYAAIIDQAPELKEILDEWALPPDDCSHTLR